MKSYNMLALFAAVALTALGTDAIYVVEELKKDSFVSAIGMMILAPGMFGCAVAGCVALVLKIVHDERVAAPERGKDGKS